MSDHESQIQELRFKAWGLPNCPTKVSLLEEAVRIADLHNDIECGYDLRQDLIEAATFSGRIDVLMVAFSWCVAQYDRDPERFDEHDLLWKYKWALADAPDFPQVSRQQIDSLLTDMERRYKAGGHSLHAVHQMRRDAMVAMNDKPAAKKAHTAFTKARVDWLSDCKACTASNTGGYHELFEKWDDVWKSYEPIVKGKLSCHSEPLRSTSSALLPLVRLGKAAKAKELQTAMTKRLARDENPTPQAAEHLVFLSVVDETAKAKRVLERYLPKGLEAVSGLERLSMLNAAIVFCGRLLNNGTTAIKVQLPAHLPKADDKGRRDVAEVRAWFEGEARKLAEQFDARNGNDGNVRALAALPELLELA